MTGTNELIIKVWCNGGGNIRGMPFIGLYDDVYITARKFSYTHSTMNLVFSDAIILEACRRTILSAGKASFPYAESMLKNWHDKGFTTLEMIEENDRNRLRPKNYGTELSIKKSPGAKTQSSFPERKYDFDALETRLLNQS